MLSFAALPFTIGSLSNPFKTREFIELKAYWDDVLKEGGLPDPDKNPPTRAFTLAEAQGKKDYYSIAKDFLTTYEFESGFERKAWSMHCEGIGYKRIAKLIGVTGYQVEQVFRRFKHYLHLRRL